MLTKGKNGNLKIHIMSFVSYKIEIPELQVRLVLAVQFYSSFDYKVKFVEATAISYFLSSSWWSGSRWSNSTADKILFHRSDSSRYNSRW